MASATATAEMAVRQVNHDNHDPALDQLDPALDSGRPVDPASHIEEEDEQPTSPDQTNEFGTKRGWTYKREGEPPRNALGKLICQYPTCANLTFDRKCEWGKHMDKHERPYKCREPGCEKLQGFTYSGGLLRHQREVHKLHGGTKITVFCPELGCKRHTGPPFTRKENLQEHLRRVHRRETGSLGDSPPHENKDEFGEDQVTSPSHMDDIQATAAAEVSEQPTLGKRKRTTNGFDHLSLEEEIRNLKMAMKERDERIEDLEKRMAEIERK